ncbi:hypothetical protein BDZ88DRAFT_53141 [Geranomyces variabilis]|nr:hypothetical protein BDZ88DRAFT_53141 [Geranomyces variabilis]
MLPSACETRSAALIMVCGHRYVCLCFCMARRRVQVISRVQHVPSLPCWSYQPVYAEANTKPTGGSSFFVIASQSVRHIPGELKTTSHQPGSFNPYVLRSIRLISPLLNIICITGRKAIDLIGGTSAALAKRMRGFGSPPLRRATLTSRVKSQSSKPVKSITSGAARHAPPPSSAARGGAPASGKTDASYLAAREPPRVYSTYNNRTSVDAGLRVCSPSC